MDQILRYNSRNIGPRYIELYNEHINDNTPKVLVNQITGSLKYTEGTKILRPTAHFGQRKLFLSELEYLSIIDNITYLVYAGAAAGLHLYELTLYFPKLIIIAVDPGNFNILVRDGRGRIQSHNRLKPPDILDLGKLYAKDRYIEIIQKKQHKIYIIQDYFTDELAELFKSLNPAFVSDIRTNIFGTTEPTDTDIVWNLAQQFNWINLMQPSSAYIKFRFPFHNVEIFAAPTGITADQSAIDRAKLDFERAKTFGIDFVSDYNNKRLTYFVGAPFVQAFAPLASTETRLYIQRDAIANKTYHNYGSISWYEDIFFYYNNIERGFIIHDNDFPDREIGFDHCGDCAVEAYIWKLYKQQKNSEINPIDGVKRTTQLLHGRIGSLKKDQHGYLFPGDESFINKSMITEAFKITLELFKPASISDDFWTIQINPLISSAENLGGQHVTNDWIVMMELLIRIGARLLKTNGKCAFYVDLPGETIYAVNHFLKINLSPFEWLAAFHYPRQLSLPKIAGNSSNYIVGQLITNKGTFWCDGNLSTPKMPQILAQLSRSKIAHIDLFIGNSLSLSKSEEGNISTIRGEIEYGLRILNEGGIIILRILTFSSKAMQQLIVMLMRAFNEYMIIKPKSSNPNKSDYYFIGIGYIPSRINFDTFEKDVDLTPAEFLFLIDSMIDISKLQSNISEATFSLDLSLDMKKLEDKDKI